jgi:hydroxymethylpyrimidine pyrophosphatase-like HAD family hydrolase
MVHEPNRPSTHLGKLLNMNYKMIGLDLDGTLLNRRGLISPRNMDALKKARDAGVLVVPCTGRAWCESADVLKQVEPGIFYHAGVFVGGSVISELSTGKTQDLSVVEPHLAMEIVRHLFDGEEAVLVFQDVNFAGRDYYVTGNGQLSSNSRWWFEHTGCKVHFQREPTLLSLHHSLRIGVVAVTERMKLVGAGVRFTFGDRVVVQHFEAIQRPRPEDSVHVLEVFARGVDKWRGLKWIADQHGIDGTQVAVIGDEINDVAMLAKAGMGIAMGNAIPEVKAVARYHTLPNEESGVGYAIEKLMSGEWA